VSSEAVRAGMDAEPVRIVSFNKSSTANWAVPWHQDRVIALAECIETPGYSNWVEKDQVWHCEPPIGLLQSLIFIRIHFDACDEKNGALEIALGSHKKGHVDARLAKDVAESHEVEVCCADQGDVLIVKALTLHRSSSSQTEGSRRALRVDYARRSDLDPRLSWSIPAV
jgi:ectoine hydroxylase-related dioxygenase (phytanoyl-CoA dioxygenase family)